MKKILIPISFSEASMIALQHGYMIAKHYGGKLTLLHCFSPHSYNREYDFGKQNYSQGIKGMLVDFFNETLENVTDVKFDTVPYSGSVAEAVREISGNYDLLVMSRVTEFNKKSNRNFSDRFSNIAIKSACPILITSASHEDFSFQEIGKVWHIKRKEIETPLIHEELAKFGIDKNNVEEKSLRQENFVSSFWKNIVAYTKTHNKVLLRDIKDSFDDAEIGLLVIVNLPATMFDMFMKDEALQIISQFDIPIMIFQFKNTNEQLHS